MSKFTMIVYSQVDRLEIYCDGQHHVNYVAPLHTHSGIGAAVKLTDCDCHEADIPLIPEDNAKPEGESVPPRTPEEFEKL